MCSKLKVFLLTGFFILIATAVFAEPFWYFHPGHTVKYTRVKANGTEWVVTQTIGNVGDSVCGGKTDYYKITECNYDGDDPTCATPQTKYLKVTETEGWQCDTDSGTEVKFLDAGQPEGYGWTYPSGIAQDDDGTRINVVSVTRFGSQITMRRWTREGGVNKPAVYNTFQRGFGLIKETDQWVGDNAPWTQVRHGYRGSTLYAIYTGEGAGVYAYDYDGKRTWTRLSSAPDSMVVSGPNLYATWAGSGLYVWDGNIWTKISSVPNKMVAAHSKLYATWVGSGIYEWNGSGTWRRISSVPDNMVASGKFLYATWAGSGLYKWDGTIWTRISSVPAIMIQGSLSGQ